MTARLNRLRRIFLGKILEEIYGLRYLLKYFAKKEARILGKIPEIPVKIFCKKLWSWRSQSKLHQKIRRGGKSYYLLVYVFKYVLVYV